MCIYCETEPFKRIVYEEEDVGKFGKILSYIDQHDGQHDPKIDIFVCFDPDYEDCEVTSIFEKEIRINYCPFCGRKLKESE